MPEVAFVDTKTFTWTTIAPPTTEALHLPVHLVVTTPLPRENPHGLLGTDTCDPSLLFPWKINQFCLIG